MNDEQFSPELLRVDPAHTTPKRKHRSNVNLRKGKFLKGPIPLPWILKASTLPGKALASGLMVWFEHHCSKSSAVKISLSKLSNIGISKSTGRRALRALENAGLISIKRPNGRSMEVTLIFDVTSPNDSKPNSTLE